MDSNGEKTRRRFMSKLTMPSLGGFARHDYDPDQTEINCSFSPPTPDEYAPYHTWSAPNDRQYTSIFGLFASRQEDNAQSNPAECLQIASLRAIPDSSTTATDSSDGTKSERNALRRVSTVGSFHPTLEDASINKNDSIDSLLSESSGRSRSNSGESEVMRKSSSPIASYLKNKALGLDSLTENPHSPDVNALDRPAFPNNAMKIGGFEHNQNPISDVVKQNPKNFFTKPIKVTQEDILFMSLKF